MSKIIIGIHGLGNKPPRKILQRSWKQSITEGLKSAGYPRIPFRFKLVYWADLIHPDPLDPEETDPEGRLYDDEPYVPARNLVKREPSELRKKIIDYLGEQLMEVFLNEDMSINFSSVTDMIIHHYFKELDMYYCATCFNEERSGMPVKDTIRNQLTTMLTRNKNNDILLIAHSMGSIIAYDVLTLCAPDVTVDTFVTIGSPLGIPVVMSKIISEQNTLAGRETAMTVPETVLRNWYNLSDLEDNMTIHYRLSDDFEPNAGQVRVNDIIVTNTYEYKEKKNPHKSYGYLRTPELAEIVHNFQHRTR